MKKIIFLNLICVLFCFACSQDDDVIFTDPAEGDWSLVNVSGTLLGLDQDIEAGVIVWTFNPAENTVTIVNNNTDEEITDFFESGTYAYIYMSNNGETELCSESLIIEDTDFGCQSFTNGDTMTLSNIWVDGYILTFVK